MWQCSGGERGGRWWQTAAGLALVALALAAALPAARAAEVASASTAHGAAASAPLSAQERRQGVLFKVSKGRQASYLFGTIHVGEAAFYPLAPDVSAALLEASRLVVELDSRAHQAFARAERAHARYGAGEHIGDHVSADTLARLTRALHGVGIAVSSVSHLKPWMIANLLLGLELERNGFNRRNGNEVFLLAQAQARGTAVAELESADYQLALFDTLDGADAERYLREALAQLADGSSLRKAKATFAAWASGESAALDALMTDAVEGGTIMAGFTRRVLLDKRNPEMVTRIASLMQDGKVNFVAVGLLHLLGPNGLPTLLAQQGFRVERVKRAEP